MSGESTARPRPWSLDQAKGGFGLNSRAALLVYLAPGVLVVVAVIQAVLTQTQDLTPWKGGGFGMFASVDRVEHRAVRLYLETEDGQVLAVPSLSAGEPAVRDLAARVQALPSDGAVGALAAEMASLDWSSAELNGARVAVLDGGDDPAASPVQEGLSSIPVDVRSARVEVLKLTFDPDDREIAATKLADVTRAAS